MRVALSVACFDDVMFPAAGKAVTALLERLGHEVVFPPGQTCCGQFHWTSGYHREAAGLARSYAAVFEGAVSEGTGAGPGTGGAEAVVATSASCAAAVRDSYPRIARAARDPGLARAAAGLPVYELSEFLVDVLGVTDVGAFFPYRVTYHPSCHSLRTLRVGDRPLRLLRAVKGIDLVDLPAARECCGFGGAFAMKNADVSVAMVADKVRHIRGTGADVVCAADDACLAHIGGALARLRGGVRTMHLAEILAETEPS